MTDIADLRMEILHLISLSIIYIDYRKILNKPVEYRDRLIDLFYGSFILDIVIAWRKDNCFAELCLVLKKYNFLRKAGNDDVIENIQLIHRRFKECMLKNVPDQMRIEDIL